MCIHMCNAFRVLARGIAIASAFLISAVLVAIRLQGLALLERENCIYHKMYTGFVYGDSTDAMGLL